MLDSDYLSFVERRAPSRTCVCYKRVLEFHVRPLRTDSDPDTVSEGPTNRLERFTQKRNNRLVSIPSSRRASTRRRPYAGGSSRPPSTLPWGQTVGPDETSGTTPKPFGPRRDDSGVDTVRDPSHKCLQERLRSFWGSTDIKTGKRFGLRLRPTTPPGESWCATPSYPHDPKLEVTKTKNWVKSRTGSRRPDSDQTQ